MITYRIYTIGPDGHFANIEVAECADDKEVVGKALAQTNGGAVEIWDYKRFARDFPPTSQNKTRPAQSE